MKRLEKGFTLVELLVVIGILGILMGVLFPTISSAMMKTKLSSCQMQGKKLYDGIVQAGISCPENDAHALWPRSSKSLSSDEEDITGMTFGTSVEYFKILFDLDNYGDSKKWRPCCPGLEVNVLYGCGVPAFKGKEIKPENVMWIVAKGIKDISGSDGDTLPVLLTRNVDYTKLFTAGDLSADDKTEVGVGKDNGGESNTPFGKDAFVLVRKNGGADVIEARYSKRYQVYKQQTISLDSEVELSYLPTGASN